ncbi:hypothetical protein QWJ34_22660 [Saccharibacillus sp. CPCC 101409]|uniref:SF0329 family protein n=1 Tax=Saccharibacillus sp. CPCC 101409 TaxID=3058041 RepID=UPI002673000D|nr:hypothetical protein [Saccharibacillus sp. CPCC 101409]MDO3412585.1 hypothetical protein [Saccharibacillus sp. CPCC 101409]
MSWSKLQQQLDSFLAPSLKGKVEYRSTSYRYVPDKAGTCHITVDKKNILNMSDKSNRIRWYQNDQEIKNDPNLQIPVSEAEIEAVRQSAKGPIPEDRLVVMARSRKSTEHAKELLAAQAALTKSNFVATANKFLAASIEESLDSPDILLNILALVDKRVGKKRISNMSETVKLKHPIVQYFYELRRRA